jgi:hypothetical protein
MIVVLSRSKLERVQSNTLTVGNVESNHIEGTIVINS